MGALEQDVLRQVWSKPEGITPGEVLEGLDADLAYTTVMTILTRLWKKGLVDRTQRGRAYAYLPAVSEAELAATRMRETLSRTADREATLSRFVDSLSRRDEAALRRILDTLDDAK